MKNILQLLILISMMHFNCTVYQKHSTDEATIPVAYERLYLAPLVSEAGLENLEGWPQDPAQQEVLLKTVSDIWNKLKAEFRKCEKLGLYEMVENSEDPSMRISVIIISAQLNGDSLRMPVRLQAERIPDGQRYIYTIPAIAQTPRQENKFHFWGLLLSQYRRNFPYKSIVSFFYSHLPSEGNIKTEDR